MLFTKSKKAVIGLAALAVMSIGGATAFAATSQLTLIPVNGVDITKIEAKMGDPADIIVAGKVDPKVLEKMENATTAPKASSQVTHTPVDDVDVTKIDVLMGDLSDIKVAGKVDLKVLDGYNKTTAPRK